MERINPGGVVEVRGVEFDYDEPVVLSLMRSQIQIPLMEITADGEGVFTQIIALPADLPAGQYNLRARSEHHLVTSPTLTVWGAAVENQESSSVQDQSDLALGPVPTIAAGVPPTAVPQTITLETPPSTGNSPTLIYSILIGVVILALLSLRVLKKR